MTATCKHCENNVSREFAEAAKAWRHPIGAGYFAWCGFQEGAPARKGDWIQTFTGRQFWALDPQPADFHILDIAAGLRNARYSCQSLRVQTVLEHSVLMRREAERRGYSIKTQRGVLLHDASEAYLVDVPRPIKRDLTNYVEIEDGIMRTLAQRFDFDWPLDPLVKEIDTAIINDEMAQNMAPAPAAWRQPGPSPLGVTLPNWDGDRAMIEFLWDCTRVGVL